MNGRVTRRAFTVGASAFALHAGSIGVVRAQSKTKVKIIYPTRSGASWPMWMAREGGFFEKYGLDAELIFGVHPAGIAALISGEAQMSNQGIEQVVAADARETLPSMVLMGSSLNRGSFGLMTRPEITSVRDLKGKRISVSRVGDVPYFFTLDLFKKFGITAADLQFVPTGADAATRANAVLTNQVDAALITAPAYYVVERKGLKLLANLQQFNDIYISTAYAFKRGYAEANPQVAEGMIKAQAEAIKRFYSDKRFAVETYMKYDASEPADVTRLYEEGVKVNQFDRVPLVSKRALAASVPRLEGDIPTIKTYDFSKMVDNRIVLGLIKQGWFEKTFGPSIRDEIARKMKTSYV